MISPLLANVYLHYVLDEWIQEEIAPRLRGRVFLIRYADDFVLGFTCEADARWVLAELPRRFAEHGLTIHPDKTRLVRFKPRDRSRSRERPDQDVPHTFDFLGFTHYWGRTRTGGWAVKRKTASSRVTRTLRAISEWCRKKRHLPIPEQHTTLVQKLRGHYAYYGITGNSAALSRVSHTVTRIWRKWLGRRNRERRWTWAVHRKLLECYPLPPPVAIHSVLRHAVKP